MGVTDVAVPDVAEPIRAYRRWTLDRGSLSGFGASRWPTGTPFAAECLPPSGRAQPSGHRCYGPPSPDAIGHAGDGCGIYAYRSLDDLVARYLPDPLSDQTVMGEVLLWGRVHEHEHGYRAEFARVERLYAHPAQSERQRVTLAHIAADHQAVFDTTTIAGIALDGPVARLIVTGPRTGPLLDGTRREGRP